MYHIQREIKHLTCSDKQITSKFLKNVMVYWSKNRMWKSQTIR